MKIRSTFVSNSSSSSFLIFGKSMSKEDVVQLANSLRSELYDIRTSYTDLDEQVARVGDTVIATIAKSYSKYAWVGAILCEDCSISPEQLQSDVERVRQATQQIGLETKDWSLHVVCSEDS